MDGVSCGAVSRESNHLARSHTEGEQEKRGGWHVRGVAVHSSQQREDERGEVEAEAKAHCEPKITCFKTTGFNASPTTLQ